MKRDEVRTYVINVTTYMIYVNRDVTHVKRDVTHVVTTYVIDDAKVYLIDVK